ncbi:MAG: S8 family peptidase [Nanobdellota archaeon]
MAAEDDLEDFLNELAKHYNSIDNDFSFPRKTEDGYLVICGRKVTDYFALDIEDNKNKHTVKTKKKDKLKYRLAGDKEKALDKLQKRYLKEKEEYLENLVIKDKVIATDRRTKEIEREVQHLKRGNEEKKKETTGNLIIRYDGDPEELSYNIRRSFSNTELNYEENLPFISLKSDIKDMQRIKEDITNNNFRLKSIRNIISSVAYVEEEPYVYIPGLVEVKNPVRKGTLWNLDNIGVYDANEISEGEGAKVAIVDTGADYTHNEIAERFGEIKGKDFAYGRDPMDKDGHGTHVSGTVAGKDVGVAPEAQLYAVKVLGDDGAGSTFDVIKGINWSINNAVDVINMSLGSPKHSKALEDICMMAYEKGIDVVAAAGNAGDEIYEYPAANKGVISVAAVDRNNEHAGFSNRNDMNDISAPGVSIKSSIPNNKYDKYDGTSMASPHVSGVCALAKSQGLEDIENKLKDTSQYLGEKDKFGEGLVRADNLMEEYK